MNAKARRLLLVGHLPPDGLGAGGQATQFGVVLEAVRRRGIKHNVISLFPKAHTGRPTLRRALELLVVLNRYALAMFFGRLAIYLSIAKSRQGFARDAAMIWIGKSFGHRVVVHLNEGSYDDFYEAQPIWLRATIRATLRKVDGIIIVSPRFRVMFDFEPTLASKIMVIPNPTPWMKRQVTGPKSIEPGRMPLRVLYLSLMIESKGYLDLLSGLAIAVNELELDVEAHFVGPFATNASDDRTVTSVKQAEEQFHAILAANRLKNRVRYHGPLFGQAKEELLARAHVLVLPTRFDREAQPLCILEAMAFGCPVIATRHRAIPDMVEEDITGLFVEFGDPRGIALALARIASNSTRFSQMSAAAIDRAAEFNPVDHADQVLALVGGGAPLSTIGPEKRTGESS